MIPGVILVVWVIVAITIWLVTPSLGWMRSEIIATEAFWLAFCSGIFNYIDTQMTFRAANIPIPLVRLEQGNNGEVVRIFVKNTHQNIDIANVHLFIKLKYSRKNPDWLRQRGQVFQYKFSVNAVEAKTSTEAGIILNLVDVMEKHHPNVLQIYNASYEKEIKIAKRYYFDLTVKIRYKPLITGGKIEVVTYKGALIRNTLIGRIPKPWDVDILQYPEHIIMSTKIG